MSSKYRAAVFESLFLGFDTYLVILSRSGERLMVPSSVKRILDNCHVMDTIEGHTVRVSNLLKLTDDKKLSLKQLFADLCSKGLLIPVSEVYSATAQNSRQHIPITSVAFVTADRVEYLARALASYSDNFQTFGRDVHVIIMDDSKDAGLRKDYLRNAARFSRPGAARYAGSQEKQSFVQELAKCGIDPNASKFAILGEPFGPTCTIGANRNAVLLDTVGEHVFTADDDTVCRFATHPARQAQLRLTSHENPRDIWFYENRQEVQRRTNWGIFDLLGEHERMLGKHLNQLVAERSNDVLDLDHACNHLIEGIQSGEGKVIATMSGIVGDSGAICPQAFLTSTGEARRNLSASEKVFETAFLSREVLWVVRSDTITHNPLCQATTIGLANADLLAPFFPFGRNEDGAFGVINQMITPTAFLGHVPTAVFHDADPGKTYESFPPFRVSELFISLVSVLPLGPTSNKREALRRMGSALSEIAKLASPDFSAYLLHATGQTEAERLRQLDHMTKNFEECPPYWKREVSKYFAHATARLKTGDGYIPRELREGCKSEAAAKTKTKELVGIMGALLSSWPDMVDASAHLKARGIRLSVGVQEA